MPKKYVIAYRESAEPIREPLTKFGGQPVWLDEPCWPLSRSNRTPMQFICQIALPADLFGDLEARMAYLFITDDLENGYIANTYEPDGGENAVIIQPSNAYPDLFLPLREGPTLYRRTQGRTGWAQIPVEFTVELHPSNDPEDGAWTERDPDDEVAWEAYMSALMEDKVGGIPVPTVNTNPREEFPADEWRFVLQLNAKDSDNGDLFFLNFAWDGVGYLFLSLDGRRGKFLWSR